MAQNLMKFRHGSHIGAHQPQLPREQMPQIDSDVWTGRSAAGHERAGGLEATQALVPGCGSDVFDDDIDAFFIRNLADFLGDLQLVVVDAVVSAERACLSSFSSFPR